MIFRKDKTMKSPEKPHKQEGSSEGKEGLHSTIQILTEVAQQFHALDSKAKILLIKKDAAGYKEKLRVKAQLLVDLPDRLASSLEGVDQETRQEILRGVSYFAASAQEALESGVFSLGVLLTNMGDKIGGKNDLEKLIESLESK